MIVNGKDLYKAWPVQPMEEGKVSCNGVSHGMSEAGYDIRIAQTVKFKALLGFIPFIKVGDGPWKFGRFALASAHERFAMPPDLVGIVHDKSTWARRTLSVFNTVIEPGWHGFLTLELVFHGGRSVTIPAGSGIAQVVFHQTTCKMSYDGKYQDQPNEPVPARESK